MKPLFVFLLGVLVGWLIEWLIDYFYWRTRHEQRMAAANAPIPVPAAPIPARAVEVAPAPEPVAVTPEPEAVTIVPDDLKVIKGIGPVISRKLNEAGIYTFEQLGALTADDLRGILGKLIQRLADEDDLLKQARKLARKK